MMLRSILLLTIASSCLAVSLPSEDETQQVILEEESPVIETVVEPVVLSNDTLADDEIDPELCAEDLEEDLDPEICGSCKNQAGDLDYLYYNSGEWLNIFADVKFSCRGRVTKWKFYAKSTGKVYLTVWRPRPSDNAWRFIGKNLVRVWRCGVNTFYIPRRRQIYVRRGDVIGIQYPQDEPDADIPTERGIIPYENDDTFPWDNPEAVETLSTFPFSRIHNVQLFDEDIDPSEIRRGVRFFKRRAALAAFVNVRNPCWPNPCKHGGRCIVKNGVKPGFKCKCPKEYIGELCDCELECELAGGPLQHLSYDSGTWLNIFTDYSFPCSGYVVEWRFYAKEKGQIYLTAWRPGWHGEGSYQLIGKNLVKVRRLGRQRAFIAKEDQFWVQAGDVMGIHYPDELANPGGDRGVIPYADTRPGGSGLCCGIEEEHLSEIYNVDIQDTEIGPVGSVHDGPHIRTFKRAVALAAYLCNPICGLQLGPRRLLSYDSGQWLNVFVDRPIGCEGKLFRWEFYAKLTGTFYLSVWQGNLDDGFTLKGYNQIVVDSTGTIIEDIDENDQIYVSDDDVIGIFYPDRPADAPTDRGIIPYQNDDDFPWWSGIYKGDDEVFDDPDEDFDFMQIHNVDIQESDVTAAGYVAGPPYRPFERMPALAGYVNEEDRTSKVL